MRLGRFVKWAVLLVAMGVIIFVACLSVYLRIEQYRFRRQAERLLTDLRGLELKKAGAAEVHSIVKKWGFDEWGQGPGPGKPCTEDDCIYRLELARKTGRDISSDPFASGGATLPLEWLGARPSVVHAWAQMHAKVLTSVSFEVWTLGQGCDARGRLECTLMGFAETKQRRGGWSSHQQPDIKLKQYLLHPSYLVGAFPEWLNADTGGSPAVIVWAELFPDANTEDVSHLMQFDLSCLTRLLSCRERDLMPTVWAQSAEDTRRSPNALTCTPELSKRVAEIADAIAIVRPKTVELRPPHYDGRSPQLRDLEIVDVIKKPDEYAPQLANVDVEKPEMLTTTDTKSPLRAGQEYVFLLQVHNTPEIGWIALYPCGALSMNDASLAMARDAANNRAD
jgi:hypothetical protein